VSRILLADDSPHAQRMGERILREEGYEVVSITDGQTALLRLRDVDPDLVLADVFLPLKSGFDVSRYVKSHPEHRHARVVLTAGLLEPFDEQEALLAGCDAILKKPFEASAMLETVKRLIAEAQVARGERSEMSPTVETTAPVETIAPVETAPPAPPVAPAPEVDPERVRAAVTLALDASMPAMIEEITQRVLVALGL
jgi:PleD family two-component response regulator